MVPYHPGTRPERVMGYTPGMKLLGDLYPAVDCGTFVLYPCRLLRRVYVYTADGCGEAIIEESG